MSRPTPLQPADLASLAPIVELLEQDGQAMIAIHVPAVAGQRAQKLTMNASHLRRTLLGLLWCERWLEDKGHLAPEGDQ
jgi:hypothetical protein